MPAFSNASSHASRASRAAIAARFFEFLERRDVAYCVAGDDRALPERIAGDIDIVVHPTVVDELAAHLTDFCAENDLHLVQCLKHEVESFYFVLCWRDDDGHLDFLHLDICGDYYRGARFYLSAEVVLDGRTRARDADGTPKSFYVPLASRAFIYYLVKRVDKQSLDERHGEFLSARWQADPAGALEQLGRFWAASDATAIAIAAALRDWSIVRSMFGTLRRSLHQHADRLTGSRTSRRELARRFDRVLHPTGLFVAVVGTDGSGKTTVVERLATDLAPAFRRTQSHHLRARFGRRARAGPSVSDPHGQSPRGGAASVAKAVYYLCDYIVGFHWYLRPGLVRSTLLLFDRYAYDLEADPKRFRYGGPMSLARLVRRLAPQPDIVILLDAPPDVLQARKSELPPDELPRIARAYRTIVAGVPNAHVVDAAQPCDGVVAAAEGIIIGYLAQRFQDRHGGTHAARASRSFSSSERTP